MIGFLNLKQINFQYNDEILEVINRAVCSGWYILVEEVEKFKKEFSCYIGTKYGIGVNSGSDALFLALKALKISKDDEIKTISYIFI